MLTCLWLWTWLVACNSREKKKTVKIYFVLFLKGKLDLNFWELLRFEFLKTV